MELHFEVETGVEVYSCSFWESTSVYDEEIPTSKISTLLNSPNLDARN